MNALTRSSVAQFETALKKVVEVIRLFHGSLTPREKLVLQLGLRAAHMEEALAAGDLKRAEDHQRAVIALAQALSIPRGTSEPGGRR